jgi:hypothetical protein
MYLLRGKYGKAIAQYKQCLSDFASGSTAMATHHHNEELALQLCLGAAYFKAKRFLVCLFFCLWIWVRIRFRLWLWF